MGVVASDRSKHERKTGNMKKDTLSIVVLYKPDLGIVGVPSTMRRCAARVAAICPFLARRPTGGDDQLRCPPGTVTPINRHSRRRIRWIIRVGARASEPPCHRFSGTNLFTEYSAFCRSPF